MRESTGMTPHKDIADDLHLRHNANGFDIHFQAIAIHNKRLIMDLKIVFCTIGKNIFDEIIVQISHLDTMLPVGVVYQKRGGMRQHFSGDIDGKHLAFRPFGKLREYNTQILVRSQHIHQIRIEFLLL